MTDLSPHQKSRPTTQAAEGLPRLKWTVADLDRMLEAGIFDEDDRIELIGGELVPMSPKGIRHEIVRDELLNFFMRRLAPDLRLSSEVGWRPDTETYLEPDLLVCPRDQTAALAPADVVHLIIEVAQSSMAYDTGTKALTYAALGVRDYWVVNAATLEIRVHRTPSATGYADASRHSPDVETVPLLVPALAIRMNDLGIE